MRTHDGMLHDDAFRERDTRQRAELRVAALDQLTKPVGRQTGRDRIALRRLKLTGVTRQRAPLRLVLIADVDDERLAIGRALAA